MSNTEITLPSANFQRGLAAFEASAAINPHDPAWLQMTLALARAYRTLSDMEGVSLMFDLANPFDQTLLIWCREAECREADQPTPFLNATDLPRPSTQFQQFLAAFQKSLRSKVQKQLPESLFMGAALTLAHKTLRKADDISAMFDADNPFDLAMLCWCTEAQLRTARRKQHTRLDLSLN